MKKVAILGATGYIGKSLAYEFMAHPDAYELYLFSRSVSTLRDTLGDLGMDVSRNTYCELSDFSTYDYDVIINCTGVSDPMVLKQNPKKIIEITEGIDQMVLGYLREHISAIYIYISSGAVYGSTSMLSGTELQKAYEEGKDLNAGDCYMLSKINIEKAHMALPTFNIVDLRVFSFFSRFFNKGSHFLMSDIVTSLQEGKIFETSDEDIVRDYVSPSDLFALVECSILKEKIHDVFDVYSKRPVSKFELLSFLKERYNLSYTIKELPPEKKGLSQHSYYATNRKAETIGYEPKYTSLEGIEDQLALMAKRGEL